MSRKKQTKTDYFPKPREGPNKDGPIPVLLFHGVKQVCDEYIWNNLVSRLSRTTEGVVECIEIGDGPIASVFTSIKSQGEEACNKVKEHPVFGQQ